MQWMSRTLHLPKSRLSYFSFLSLCHSLYIRLGEKSPARLQWLGCNCDEFSPTAAIALQLVTLLSRSVNPSHGLSHSCRHCLSVRPSVCLSQRVCVYAKKPHETTAERVAIVTSFTPTHLFQRLHRTLRSLPTTR